MRHPHPRRGIFTGRGFTLIELLISISLIGIIAALLIPNLTQARQEAYRQTARQQAKVLEKAMAAWFTAQPSIDAASTAWNSFGPTPANGYINNATFLTSANGLAPYLTEGGTTRFSMSGYIITTPEMAQLTAPLQSGTRRFIGGLITNPTGINTAATTAHVVLYWDPTSRTVASPRVQLFLPDIL